MKLEGPLNCLKYYLISGDISDIVVISYIFGIVFFEQYSYKTNFWYVVDLIYVI